MKGNPAVPLEIKEKRGTLRKDRIPGGEVDFELEAVDDVPPPGTLRAAGAAEWRASISACPWLAPSDLAALRIQCELIDRREIIIQQLFGMGAAGKPVDLLLETTTGYAYSNPLLVSLLKVEAELARWTSLLGKTPSDRSRLGLAQVKTKSKLDELANRKRARQAAQAASAHDARSETAS